MNLEQLSAMTEDELQAKANEHLEQLDNRFASNTEKDHHATQAQVFVAELERRKQAKERIEGERIAARDYKLELWVIGLIGAELVIALVAIVFGWIEGTQQTKVLDKLNKSGAETAATLATLQKEQEAALETQKHTLENITTMNDALQEQTDWNFADVLEMSTSSGDGRFSLVYRGRVNLFMWGSKFDGELPAMQQKPTTLNLGAYYNFDISRIQKKLFQIVKDGSQTPISFELYLKAPNGTKYVAKSRMILTRQKDNGMLWCETIALTRQQW